MVHLTVNQVNQIPFLTEGRNHKSCEVRAKAVDLVATAMENISSQEWSRILHRNHFLNINSISDGYPNSFLSPLPGTNHFGSSLSQRSKIKHFNIGLGKSGVQTINIHYYTICDRCQADSHFASPSIHALQKMLLFFFLVCRQFKNLMFISSHRNKW